MISDSTAGDRPIIFTNPAFTRISGYTAAEARGWWEERLPQS